MIRGPYDPPGAPVVGTKAEPPPARWRWLCVPIGHAMLTFFLLVAWLLFAPRPGAALIPGWALDSEVTWWMARNALFQGGILLGTTVVTLWALPKIQLRHAAYVALATAAATFVVDLVDAYLRGSITNGEYVERIVVTCAVVLLLSGIMIRKVKTTSPNTSLERTREG